MEWQLIWSVTINKLALHLMDERLLFVVTVKAIITKCGCLTTCACWSTWAMKHYKFLTVYEHNVKPCMKISSA